MTGPTALLTAWATLATAVAIGQGIHVEVHRERAGSDGYYTAWEKCQVEQVRLREWVGRREAGW